MAHESEARNLGLVVTGGTVGSSFDPDHVVRIPRDRAHERPAEVELLTSLWQGPMKLDLHLRQPVRLLSENMRPADWVAISQSIVDLVKHDGASGVIVLHGTDTATYTAAALSFLLSNLHVPTVITGSNLPPNQERSDARTNIRDALIAVCNLGPGCYLSFAGEPQVPSFVHLGTKVRKLRASGQAYASINRQPVAQIANSQFIPISLSERTSPPTSVHKVSDRVAMMRIYPGCDLVAFRAALARSDARGVVLELYASGTGQALPGPDSVPDFVRSCVDDGIVVVGTVPYAPERAANEYESSLAVREAGALFFWDLLPETALVKLMWALGQSSDADTVRRFVAMPVAGEFEVHDEMPARRD